MEIYNRALTVRSTATPLGLHLGHNAATRSLRCRVSSPCNHNANNYGVSSYGYCYAG